MNLATGQRIDMMMMRNSFYFQAANHQTLKEAVDATKAPRWKVGALKVANGAGGKVATLENKRARVESGPESSSAAAAAEPDLEVPIVVEEAASSSTDVPAAAVIPPTPRIDNTVKSVVLKSGKVVGPGSSAIDIQTRLIELGTTSVSGTKAQMWSRLVQYELEHRNLARQEEYVEIRRQELQAAARAGIVQRRLGVPGADSPTDEERVKHEVNAHYPPQKWCEHCQIGRGVDDAHYRKSPHDGIPVAGMDLMFARGDLPEGVSEADMENHGIALVIVGRDISFPEVVPKPDKLADEYTQTACERFLKSLFHDRVTLRPDNEGVMKVLAQKIEARMPGRVNIMPTARYSSQSNPAETHQTN